MFGNAPHTPQNETTPFNPRSPYGISKVAGFYLTKNYREAYGIHASSGILFNHESPRRGFEFVTRKITSFVAKARLGTNEKLRMGNLDARRDWGFSPEYVEVMWRMLQQGEPDDYVIGTGKAHTVREFLEEAFGYVGIGLEWQRNGANEKGIVRSLASNLQPSTSITIGDVLIETDPRYYRPAEVNYLMADASKAKKKLGWKPRIELKELVRIMVDADLEHLGVESPGEGKRY